ncbi:magnesium transporter CorA family protein [Oceanirhabdus seepicola]|uniref:Magnesium transporter CorA family protein n=1 Tax=Oceanirhabdus seepicola TaxID=2828781 RepID=A0A9J6P1X9_9CLOT|nr:magnesium transporter CorA family protein [Oceanirhabdus seepicola]MCM1990631.1 magnesium transporter CorA family protein [Oceanirhabdus seepicola]
MRVYDIMDNFKEVKGEWKEGKSNYWILVKGEEIKDIQNKLNLDDDSIFECIDMRQASKISFYSNYMFLVCNVLIMKNKIIIAKEINIYLSKDYIITVFKDKLELIEKLLDDINCSRNCFMLKDKPNPSVVLYYIMDRIIIRNYDIIQNLEAFADKIEINILKNPKNEQIDELIHLRRQVYKTRKYLNPLRYIGDSILSNENDIIEQDYIQNFVSVNTKIDKLLTALESLVQDLALVREAFESEIANKTNELMKIFTLISAIFLPLNLLTSMYGMNFKKIPFIECNNGYYYFIIIMILITLLLIIIFKRKKWL